MRDERAVQVRDELVFMLGGLWMIIGLYLDGWSHQANKPETFFTPWHGVLYSGFAAVVLYAGWIAVRDARVGVRTSVGDDRLTALGLVLFAIGAGGDFVWHSLVGIEEDIEGLVSPTHLSLMIGGLLMVTMPIRAAFARDDREITPAVALSVALSVGVLAFFLMYLMPWNAPYYFEVSYVPDDELSNFHVVAGMASVMVTTALLLGAVLWTARHWTPPRWMATTTFTAVALGVAAMSGFEVIVPVLAATVAGLVVDALLADGRALSIAGLAGGAVFGTSLFALQHAEGGVGWGPSLWGGAVVFAALIGYALGTLLTTSRSTA